MGVHDLVQIRCPSGGGIARGRNLGRDGLTVPPYPDEQGPQRGIMRSFVFSFEGLRELSTYGALDTNTLIENKNWTDLMKHLPQFAYRPVEDPEDFMRNGGANCRVGTGGDECDACASRRVKDGCVAREIPVPCKPCRDQRGWCALNLPCQGEEGPVRTRIIGRMATVSRNEEEYFKFTKSFKEACVESGGEGPELYGKMARWVHVDYQTPRLSGAILMIEGQIGPAETTKVKGFWETLKAAANPRRQAIALGQGFRWKRYAYDDVEVEGDVRDVALVLLAAD